MKKIVFSSLIILAFFYYVFLVNSSLSSQVSLSTPVVSVSPTPSHTVATTDPTPVATGSGPTPTPPPSVSAGLYKNGTYTGPSTDATFGNIQVQVTISGNKISDIAFLQYPNDRPHSVQVSQQALPVLKSEAIAAQSANVDIVSGATQDTQAFQKSLAAALAMAQN